LIILCLSAISYDQTEARIPDGISVSSANLSPVPAMVGQETRFSASYAASPNTGSYMLHACKSRKISGGICTDGSWCDSSSYTADNPIGCAFTPAAAGNNYAYYLFVCDNTGKCSSSFLGIFSVINSALGLEVPAAIDFGILPFSFSSQKSAPIPLGDLVLTATNSTGWSLDVTAQDWTDAVGNSFDIDGDGAATGQLTVNLDGLSIDSSDPLAAASIARGITSSFSPASGIINIASSQSGSAGIFVLKGIDFEQFLPAGQEEGDYTTVVTFTVS
jgi:hypothetical protein